MKLEDLSNPGVLVSDTITVTTDSNGEADLKFYASRWGGKVKLRASTDYSGSEMLGVDSLTIKVPDLVPLPVSNDYVKFGGTGRHPGPDDNCFNGAANFTYEPDENHWALQSTIDTLLAVNATWKAKGMDKLWINDMSLRFGGHFDVFGYWDGAHRFHRVGRDVDVKTTRTSSLPGVEVETVSSYTDGDGGTVIVAANKDFEIVATDHGLYPVAQVHGDGTGNEHYHLFFY
jgi:hypothetical protein